MWLLLTLLLDYEGSMDLGLKGLKAIVTGVTRGIGRAIADTLAAEGCDVAICARNSKEVAATIATLASKGVNATGAAVDVSDGPLLRAWVAEAAEALHGIEIVVANVSATAVSDDEAGWSTGFQANAMVLVMPRSRGARRVRSAPISSFYYLELLKMFSRRK